MSASRFDRIVNAFLETLKPKAVKEREARQREMTDAIHLRRELALVEMEARARRLKALLGIES